MEYGIYVYNQPIYVIVYVCYLFVALGLASRYYTVLGALSRVSTVPRLLSICIYVICSA
jgi:hypothetical protein